MAYGTPSDPVGGTVITVAYAQANILDPIRWLRLLTGNADPPGSSYVVVSTSTSGTSWQKLPGDALAAGAVATHLGYTPANRGGDTFTGAIIVPSTLTVLALNDLGSGGRILLAGSSVQPSALIDNSGNFLQFYNLSDPTKTMAFSLLTGGLSMVGPLAAASAAIVGAITAASAAIVGHLTAATAAVAGAFSAGATTLTSTLSVAGTTTAAAINSGAVTSTGIVTGTRLAASVTDGTTPPISIHVNQAAVTVPNLKAAVAVVAESATSATNAATAANASALDSLDSTQFARLAATSDFTTPPTINGVAVGLANSASVVNHSSSLSLTASMQDIPGLSITAPSTGTYLVIGIAFGFAQVAGGDVTAQVAVAGSVVGTAQKVNQPQFGTTPDAPHYGGGPVLYAGSITVGQAVTLRAKSAVASTSTIDNGQLSLIRIA